MKEGIGIISYYSLASGFLTGKYRTEEDLNKSVRGKGIAKVPGCQRKENFSGSG